MLGSLRGSSSGRPLRCARAASALQVDGDVDPLGAYVLIKVDEADEMSKGGIILAKKTEKPRSGEVLKVGPGEAHLITGNDMPVLAQPGQRVLYSRYVGGDPLKCADGSEQRLVREDEILLMYEGDEAKTSSLTMPRGKVLVRLLEGREETDSGILLSKGAVEETTTVGEVISVGPGEIHSSGKVLEPTVAVGEIVRFRFGDEVDIDLGDEGRFSSVRTSNCIAKWKAA